MTTFLIPRDLPIDPGRKIVFSFTVAFDVTLDENVLDYRTAEGDASDLAPATLDEVEQWMGGVHRSSEQLFMHLAANSSRQVVDHDVRLDDRYEGADERFETTWEQRERLEGKTSSWASRVWIDEIPSAGALPLGPESNPPVPSSVRASDLTAEEVMSRDG